MTKEYCKDCACLVAGDKNEWVCDELQKEVEDITKCPEQNKITFEEWKELPYVKSHWYANDFILRKIFNELSEEEKLCMKNDERCNK